ncbi:uncharacterized sodium-dependent transporter YocR-like [Ruditapes philippinarum]|uniref:uncharacterized sodium-dependent transporter YocR-like n=1 Tax=Ruditapes philippinarum TaxID=129788 RepID=UPI00295B3959|nr:uncharacterized sodium-dependent transporter YocR-like [Ruditapes philippinarum]
MDYDNDDAIFLNSMSDSKNGRRYRREAVPISEEIREAERMNDDDVDGDTAHFQSTFGLVLSCMGCVVGTGNIWRFPRIVAQNSNEEGGLVFLIVWLMFLFLWSSPLLLLEYGTGRYTKKAVLGSFRQFLGDNHIWCGAWISMVTFCISCFYSVVLGWCFYYFIYYIGHSLPASKEEADQTFKDYAEDSYWPVLTHFIAILFGALCVTRGVKTIEKVSIVLVPLLLLIILFTFTWSLTRKYTDVGIRFLFTPHWESFKEPRLWVDAMSQNAFDTGAGMGLMIPYSAYMTKKNGIVKYGHLVPSINNLVSLLCGITIFGTVFSSLMESRPYETQADIVNIMKDSGPASTGLTFIWMPVLFETIGSFGRVMAVLFFLCLSFAGITSLMSNLELMTKTFTDFGLDRKYGMSITVILTFSLGLPSALNINILTNQDFVWGFALVINGMMMLYMAMRFGIRKFRDVIVNNYSENDWKLTIFWEVIIRVVAPIEAIVLIVWWAVDLINQDEGDGEAWYTFGRETLVMTVTQWFGLMLILIILNIIYVLVRGKRIRTFSWTYESESESEPLVVPRRGPAFTRDFDHSHNVTRDLDGSVSELRL